MLNNKRGFFPLIPVIVFVALIAVVVLLISFFQSMSVKLAIAGIGILVGGFYVLGKGMTGDITKNKIVIVLVIFALGAGLIFFSGIQESIFSQSTVNVGTDGKVYWVLTASANKAGDVFTFTPKTYTFPDGKQVQPKSNLVLAVSPIQPQCSYLTTKVTKTTILPFSFFGLNVITYYTLGNPEKIANVEFADGNGKIVKMDGTVVQSAQIGDVDGTGKVTIESQGLLGGKYNCPSNTNTVMIVGSDNKISFLYKNEVDTFISSPTLTNKNNLRSNTEFTNTMVSVPTLINGKLVGEMNIGYVVYTITADQDYFDSTVYTPPKSAEPIITSINAPSEIKQDGSSSMTVNLKNTVSSSGLVIVKATSSKYGISPSSQNVQLSGTQTVSFNIKATSSLGCSDIDVEACGVDQFSATKCDIESKNVCTISSAATPSIFCGDNVCQASETFNTCPADCKPKSNNNSLECNSIFEYEGISQSTDYGKFYWRVFTPFVDPITISTPTCKTRGWVYGVIAGTVILGLGVVSILLLRKPKRGMLKKR